MSVCGRVAVQCAAFWIHVHNRDTDYTVDLKFPLLLEGTAVPCCACCAVCPHPVVPPSLLSPQACLALVLS